MRLHEYEGKAILRQAGIDVPAGAVVAAAQAVPAAMQRLGDTVVVKAQVLAGGRGRDGGIEIVAGPERASAAAAGMLQRPCRGQIPMELLIEQRLEIATELYAAVTIDMERGRPLLLLGLGGVDVEDQARTGNLPARLVVDPLTGPSTGDIAELVRTAGAEPAEGITNVLRQLWNVFISRQALTVEINPLAVVADGGVIAADAVIELDDAAREMAGLPLRDDGGSVRRERSGGMTFVELGGDVGLICSGAGLGMASMDLISEHARPANFLETGGGISRELMSRAMRRVLACHGVKGVLINVYGGINPIHKGALGVADVMATGVGVPVVAKALGNHQEETWEVLEAAGVTVVRDVATEAAVAVLLSQMRERTA
ncbi:MAG TPA: ATP-grasp domain-containing protein [Candidatus Latescibacteria bacterium]|nr:acetate--CoA ligase family protein [Candidatus Latescibacterota bacterium]HJP34286.1 ATP-grasp domain-containing protein [Candidatus Latescibacterota bacterium]